MSRRSAPATVEYGVGTGKAATSGSAAVAALWIVTAYLLLIVAGFTVFRSTAAMVGGNEMSVPRAIFTSINAATLAGFPQVVAVEQYQPLGQITIFILMIAGTYVSLAAGGLAVARIVGLPYSAARICTFAAAAQLAATIVGGALLLVPGRGPAQAAFVAASAFGNAGFTLGAPLGGADPRALFVALPLAVFGTLGLTVLIELWDAMLGNRRTAISSHARIILIALPVAFLVGFFVCLWLAWPTKAPNSESRRAAVQAAMTLPLNARSAGFEFEPMYNYSRALQWFTMLMMFVGGAPAGTAGGLKVTTIYALLRGSHRALRGEPPGRALGFAVVWLATLFTLIFVALLYLVSNQAQLPGDRALFQVISAACNVGLTHEPLSVNASNGYVLSAAMLLGRLLPLGVLWWMAAKENETEVALG